MSYQDTIDYLYSRLPMFSRIGAAAIKNDLDNTISICKYVGNPEKKFKTIHVAGTNGKGSTSHMLASIFQEAGYTTGLYTSPHLYDFRERIKINGEMIGEQQVVDFTKNILPTIEKMTSKQALGCFCIVATNNSALFFSYSATMLRPSHPMSRSQNTRR